jgi:hypothetical protein
VANRRTLPEHPWRTHSGTYRRILSGTFQEKHSGTSQENTFRNTQEITSEIPGRLHLLPESQKQTSETSRRLLPEYPGVCPQGVEETAHGTLGRRLTEHSRKNTFRNIQENTSGTFQENSFQTT